MFKKEDIKKDLLIGQKIKKDGEEQIIEEINLEKGRIRLEIVENDPTTALIFASQHIDTFLEDYMEELEILQNSLTVK